MGTAAMDNQSRKPACYQIKIKGKIREDWSDWLSGIEISTGKDDEEAPLTTLIGEVADQAVLRGILCKLWDLNLTIISVNRIEMNAGENEG